MKMPSAIIREEIEKSGAISFARFMELALYCPETGYYESKKDTVGRGGDFITSVSVGNLFGEMLALQFAEWLEAEAGGRKSEARIIEAGAHDGKLAADILNWLQSHRPKLFSEIEYWILEPSLKRQNWQRETLQKFAGKVFWAASLEALNNSQSEIRNPKLVESVGRDSVEPKISGIFFSNELLDAFPVHRYGWDAKEKNWFEHGVALDGEKFCWTQIAVAALPSSIFHLPSSLLDVLPDGYTIETSPAAEKWWREAAGILKLGKLVAIDYGFTADEQFSPSRTNGTARAYARHQVSDDLLANVGEQDLTAHVNFSAIQKAGEAAGLKTEIFTTQTKFLVEILEKAAKEKSFASWDSKRARQFQTLTHPEHLGRAFRVLVQSRP